MELRDRTALITGGAVRLGKSLALALAGEGVRVAVHYGRSAAEADETVAAIRALGSDAVAIGADLRRAGAPAQLVEEAASRFGRVDILINSAAIFQPGDLADTTEDLWDAHFDINLKAPFFLCRAFAAHVGSTQPGQIVNIADWRATRPGPHYLAYTLAKAGLIAMTKSLALALAPNIRVNAIGPGAILPPPGRGEDYLRELAAHIPLRRTGSPGEVASALLYLLRAEFVTGELMFVTGGEEL